jgi:hypothetical protein
MSERTTQVRLLLIWLLWCACSAQSHDLITMESAERYLAQAQQRLDVWHSRQAPGQRAEAAFQLGRMLDDIRDLLNRDLAAHGRVQGLPTEYLVRSLNAKGLTLEVSQSLGRFPANVSWYRESLRVNPDSPHASEAMFGILQGEFYDSFDVDPLQPRAQTWSELQNQIVLGERLMKLAPAHPDIEETQFILAVLYTRAAHMAPDRKAIAQYADRARSSIAQFQSRYPESLRATALPILLRSLDQVRK